MIKYYFVCFDDVIYINLPKIVSRETLSCLKKDLNANSVYTIICDDVKLFLDL